MRSQNLSYLVAVLLTFGQVNLMRKIHHQSSRYRENKGDHVSIHETLVFLRDRSITL